MLLSRFRLMLVSFAILTNCPGLAIAEENPALKAAAALYEGIRTETLPNGLRIYLKPIPGAPIVTTMMAFKVGSADENLEATGLSHYLEHLMFKGTDTLLPGDIDRLTLRNGGANNAYTSEDYTIYHFDFAADRWQLALQIEADRLRNLRIDDKHEFQQEKGAVINELARNEDEPWDLEMKAILPLLFGKEAPYGHPVIGEREHVKGATAAVIKAHYDQWYHPNNAALVMVGGFDPEQALAIVRKQFGSIPAGKLPERKALPRELPQRPARLVMESKFDAPRLLMGFPTVRITDPEDPILDVIQTLLAGGRTGRLYKKLVEGEEVATGVNASNATGRYPGWFSIQVEFLPDKDRAAGEKLVMAELKRLATTPPDEAEMRRAKQLVLAEAVYARESVHGLADSIARGVTVADLDHIKKYLPSVMAVTAADVQRVAARLLDPEKGVVVWSVPAKKGAAPGGGKPSPARRKLQRFQEGGAGSFSLKETRQVVLPNGLTLLLNENRRLPIFVAEAHVRRVLLHEPEDKAGLSVLMGNLLQEGTTKRTGSQLAEAIEDVGGALAMHSSGGSIKVLSSDRELGLELLFDCLIYPSFPKDAFARERQRLLATIQFAEEQPENRAQVLYRELAYGNHPFSRPLMGRRKAVEALGLEDCRAFHEKVFVPGNTVVALVGDFDSQQIVDEIKTLTTRWKGVNPERPKTPEVAMPGTFTQKVVSMPQATQLHLYMGHAGVRRGNPDYYALLVMDYVLGTGPGFTDRLSARLRDRQGLAYTVSANVSASAGEEPGLFTCYIGTDPENFAKVKSQFLEELGRIRDEAPSTKEVEDAKQYLIHNQPFRFTTNDRVAGQILYVFRNGLGWNYVSDYAQGVAAVTPEQVRQAAKKYLDPSRLVLVAAGPVDLEGKPLQKGNAPKK